MVCTRSMKRTSLKHDRNVDSKALWETIKAPYEGRDYRLRQSVQHIQNRLNHLNLILSNEYLSKITLRTRSLTTIYTYGEDSTKLRYAALYK